MSLPARITTLIVAFLAVVGLGVFVVVRLLLDSSPAAVNFTSDHAAGQSVNMTIMTAPVNDESSTPGWVSYFVRSPQTGKWLKSTVWELPANTRINVTAYEFDTCDPLRNQFWGKVTGTVGDVEYVSGEADGVNGKVSLVNSDKTCGVAHTFTVPDLGINVPFEGVLYAASKQCGFPGRPAPCSLSDTHVVTHFSFITPKTTGDYRWQCFIPCGLASLDGNGHAMQTEGAMSGFLDVVRA
jgi:hypothetical protein